MDQTPYLLRDIVATVRESFVVLDSKLHVLMANQSFLNLFKVTQKETVDKYIYDLGNKQWDIPELRELLENILPEHTVVDNYEVEHEFVTIGKRIMLLNARKIYGVLGKDGLILLAIEDITERKAIEATMEETQKELEVMKKSADEAREFAESIINTVRESLICLDQDLRVVAVNNSFCNFFKIKSEEAVGQLIYELGNKQWDIPGLRELLENILPKNTTFDNYEVEHEFSIIGRHTMLLNVRKIKAGGAILLAIEDITDRK